MNDAVTLSTTTLAEWLRRAETAHAVFEQSLGHRDENWADWYAAYIVQQATATSHDSQEAPLSDVGTPPTASET